MRQTGLRMAAMAMSGGLALVPAQAAPITQQLPIIVRALPNWGPSMLGTTAVRIRADRFSGSWGRAMEDASRLPTLQSMIAPARGLTKPAQMAFVQRAVNTRIRWISDATEWGQHDYWATAAQTLAHGAGDMEDRAIVKMHALHALGFDQRDLFITLARDSVGGPLTVLTVRANGRYWILDDTGGTPFLADSRSFEFQPIMSFGWAGAFVHQKKTPPAIATLASSKVTASK